MDRVFPLSDWAKILIIRRFHHACRFAARENIYFQLLTYHYIARATLNCKNEESINFGANFFEIADTTMTFKPQSRMKKLRDIVHVQLNKHFTPWLFTSKKFCKCEYVFHSFEKIWWRFISSMEAYPIWYLEKKYSLMDLDIDFLFVFHMYLAAARWPEKAIIITTSITACKMTLHPLTKEKTISSLSSMRKTSN